MTTLLVTPDELAGDEVAVEGDAYRHLFRARRLAVGDPLRVVDGAGRARAGVVAAVDRRRGSVRLGEPAASREPALQLQLLVATPRLQRAGWLVEKATELGVAAIRFVDAERAVRELADRQIARLERVAAAAVEQCGRSRLPAISGVHGAGELAALLTATGGRRFLLDVPAGGVAAGAPEDSAPEDSAPEDSAPEDSAPEDSPPGAAPAASGDPACSVLVGPEGGWSDAERRHLADLGCRRWSLGERVLRVETAAVAAAALLLAAAPAGGRP